MSEELRAGKSSGPPGSESSMHLGFLLRVLGAAALLVSSGCTRPWEVEGGDVDGGSSPQSSVIDGTQSIVSGVPGWNGGCFWPEVNLYSGNLFVNQPLLYVPGIGPDWDLRLYYNATLAGSATPAGLGWRLSCDIDLALGQPDPASITVLWGDGRQDVFVDDGNGWAAPAALEGRRILSIAGGYLLRDKHGIAFEFDAAGKLAAYRDRNGNAMTYAYDGLDRLIQAADASGRTCNFGYDGSNHLVTISGLPSQPIQLQYAADQLVRVTDPGGFSSQYAYDGLSRLVHATDYDGDGLDIEYYPSLYVVKTISTTNALRVFTYDAANRITRVTDRLGGGEWSITAYAFDPLGRITSVDDGLLGVTQNSYDPLTNHCTSHTDADGHTTTASYDAIGNRLTQTDAQGLTDTYTYDPIHNLPLSHVDRNGKTWTWQYDGNGNLLTRTDPLGNQRSFTYTGQGLMASTTDQRGFTTTLTYDSNGNPSTMTDPALFTASATYNGRSRLLTVQDQSNNLLTVSRDARDQVVSVALPAGGVYTLAWTGCGNLASMQDPNNATTSFAYDERKNLVSRTDAVGATLTLVRNGAGRVLRAIDGLGRIQEYAYDTADRMIRRVDPEGGMTTWSYGCCDLLGMVDALGSGSSFQYTSRHELSTAISPGVSKSYAYDGVSRLILATLDHAPDPQIRTGYTYDDAGRIVGVAAQHLGRMANIVLDPAGNPTSLSDNLHVAAVTYTHDNRNLCRSVALGPTRANLTYDPNGRVTRVAYIGSPTLCDYTYDANSRLVSITNLGSAFTATYSMSYNLRGDRLSVIANTPATGSLNQHVAYDPMRRALSESYVPGSNTLYTYDAIGNRIQKLKPPAPPDLYTYSAAHRLLSAGPLTQTWDARGEVVQLVQPGATLVYTYRGDGALETIKRNGQTWRFRVGPQDELAGVVLPSGQEVWYALDVADHGLLRRAVLPGPALSPTEEYLHVPGGLDPRGVASAPVLWLVSPFAAGTGRAVMTGPSGIAQIASSTGSLLSDRYFGCFGDLLASTGSVHSTQGFLGMDSEAGLPEMTIRNLGGVGGTFDAPLYIHPKLTFANTNDSVRDIGPVTDCVQFLDTGLPYVPSTGSYQRDTNFAPDDLQAQEGQSAMPSWAPWGKADKWWLEPPTKDVTPPPVIPIGPGPYIDRIRIRGRGFGGSLPYNDP